MDQPPHLNLDVIPEPTARSATSSSLPFLETVRQVGQGNVLVVHISLLPHIGPSATHDRPTRSGWRPWLHEEGTRAVDAALCWRRGPSPTRRGPAGPSTCVWPTPPSPTTGCSPWTRGRCWCWCWCWCWCRRRSSSTTSHRRLHLIPGRLRNLRRQRAARTAEVSGREGRGRADLRTYQHAVRAARRRLHRPSCPGTRQGRRTRSPVHRGPVA